MRKEHFKQPIRLISLILFSLGIIVSVNAFSAPEELPNDLKIGDFHAGGIVFYMTENGQNGLVAALTDQSTNIPWSNGIFKVTGATGDGIGAGMMNTSIIVSAQSNDTPGGIFAAKVAADYAVLEDGFSPCAGSAGEICYSDWYLPSKNELNLLYENLFSGGVGGFANALYWSSTEARNELAWNQNFLFGLQNGNKKNERFRVRAIRVF
ncbi:MAG: DUF1566 domain-containing protein [Nitrosomonas sp.]|nr:DUF1566 domain-containing protein [Nitrosomonas sp.]